MSRLIKILITFAVLLAILLGALGASWYFYRNTHVKVDGVIYEKNLSQLDLRGQQVTAEQYEKLQKNLPGCRIRWDVPFQNTTYPDDTAELAVTTLSQEDLQQLRYFKDLQKVDAAGCSDYDQLQKLMETYPNIDVNYTVSIDGQELPRDTESISFAEGRGSYEELVSGLSYLPQVQTVSFLEPEIKPDQLLSLREKYPEISFSWEKTVFGERRPDNLESLDISGRNFTSIQEVQEQAAYLPGLKTLVMCDTGLPNEDIAGFRESLRGQCKVIWNVKIGQFHVRTDETWFMPTKFGMDVKDREMQNMKYCEDMVCIDVGHNVMMNLDWVKGTPHLKYLIVADCPLKDVTPLGTLKELKFLELFMTDIRDISPIVGCTALEDLNVARIPASLRPLGEMKWLKNLWMSGGRVSKEDQAYLREQLPDTRIDAALHHDCTGRGWRDSQNYIDMRNMMGMPLMK